MTGAFGEKAGASIMPRTRGIQAYVQMDLRCVVCTTNRRRVVGAEAAVGNLAMRSR